MAALYGLILGPVTGLLLEPFSHRAGTAAALNGALQFMIAPIMVSIFVSENAINGQPYGLPLFIMSCLCYFKMTNKLKDKLRNYF